MKAYVVEFIRDTKIMINGVKRNVSIGDTLVVTFEESRVCMKNGATLLGEVEVTMKEVEHLLKVKKRESGTSSESEKTNKK